MFVPAVEVLEEEIKTQGYANSPNGQTVFSDEEEQLELLSSREKDIVRCVAMGLSNKEIADYLNLSIHTVTTHRRNIASKLQIHSMAGLTIYAIANKLVDLKDIKL